MHHKRKRPKGRRAGCLFCKPHKMSGMKKRVHIRGMKGKTDLDMVPSSKGKGIRLLSEL